VTFRQRRWFCAVSRPRPGCTCARLRRAAANATAEGIALRSLRIDLAGDLDLGAFLGLRPGHAGFDTITATVHLDTDADPAQVQRLHDAVVGSSPVGHTLQAAIPVDIQLADGSTR
jgi:hypothetical protein